MSHHPQSRLEPRAGAVAGVVALQSLAVAFFIVDAAADVAAGGLSPHVMVEMVAALGVVVPSLDRERTRLSSAAMVAAQGIGRELARAAEFSRLADGGWT